MATIKSPMLFFVTSPRTPAKMRPEIRLLVERFAGQKWNGNSKLQSDFMDSLSHVPDFEGGYNHNDPALSARDRITRAPKALGFVKLEKIGLTSAGAAFLDDDNSGEALLRQLLKFQLPSPFHRANPKITKTFWIRPYLEILRLIYSLGRLSFDELALFGMQLTDYRQFDVCVEAIREFRIQKESNRGHYKQFRHRIAQEVIKNAFATEIAQGHIKTRESRQVSLESFIRKKVGNLRDYADACVRYLRATGLVTISNPGRTLTIIESRREDVGFILNSVDRNPVFVNDEVKYREHLYDATTPVLYTDNREALVQRALQIGATITAEQGDSLTLNELKSAVKKTVDARRSAVIAAQVTELKSFAHYDEVVDMFDKIKHKDVYDPALALEWNTWRAMTMLDGGTIRANLTFDDVGNPLSTAPGKMPDIVCDYSDFFVAVEVTLLSGSRQFDAEGEPVARHLGELKGKTGKIAYCFFIAPSINKDIVPYFYMLQKTEIQHYGGKSVIVPLPLDKFVGMIRRSKECGYIPAPNKVREFFESIAASAQQVRDEQEWYATICHKAEHWLNN